MSSITVKLISIACVLAMLLTGMQVMTGEVVASGNEGDRGLVTDPSAKKRLTMSESSARDPATVTSEGFTYLVWIDSSENGEKVCWKKTGGDGVYTSTELLSPRFERINTLDISANGGTVAVVYVALTNGATSTYIVCSSDSGQSWGKNYVLGEGSATAVSVLNDRAYVCQATKLDGNDTVTVIQVDIKDGEPSNGVMLLTLPFEASLVDVLADEAGVHYAAAADDPCVVIYGHIGEELSEPVMIHSQSSGVIDDIELMSSDGDASALIASNLDGGSLIFLAESFDGPAHWSERILANGEGRFSDLSYASYDGSVIVAWANSSPPGAIEALELRGGQVARSWKVIEGAVSSPSVFAESDGISCTWSEDDGYGTELYSLSNIQFRAASFDQVLGYAAGLDEAAFRPDVTDAREHLLDDLDNVSAYIRLGDVEGVEDAIVHVMGHIDGFVVMSQSDDLLLSTSACENIFGKLQAARNDIMSVGLHSDPFTRWAIGLPAEHGAVPAMAAFDTGATPSLATIRGCINAMSVSGEPGGDAPGTLAGALTVEPGRFTGSVNSSDTTDCFEIKVYNPPYHNQMIYVDLDVPSGFNLNMKLYTPSGVLVRTAELGTGEDEHIEYLTAYEGYHVIQIYWVSGSGTANYEVEAEVAGGLDYFYLDVGASGDTTVNTPGLSILDGSGWSSPSNSKRTGSSNSTMLLNLFSASYQANTSYMVGFQYTASSEVTVSVYNGGGWVDVGSLPGRSTIWVANVIMPSEHLYDALPEVAGMNVMVRFSSSIALDFVDAVAYSYTTGAAPGTSYHNPGVGFESGWTFDGAVVNGTAGATIIVNVPVQTMVFTLEIAYSDAKEIIGVQQLSFDGYVTIGNLYRWGDSAVISLQRGVYYDTDTSAPGYNIRLKFVSSIANVTSITMRPCDLYTVVGGVYDDSGRYRNPGVNIYNNGHWSNVMNDGGRTYRSTLDGSALFFVNGAVSGNYHEVELLYRSSASFTVSQWTGSSFINVATMPASASWTTASFRIDPSNFVDYMWSNQLNILFKIGTASVSVAEFHLLIDSDNDGAVDRMEANRIAGKYLNPFSADTDSDGLKDIDEGYFGTIYGHTSPWDPDSDDDGLLDGAEKWSQSWSTDKFYKVPNGSWANRAVMAITIPSIPTSVEIAAVRVHVGIVTDRAQDIEVWMYKVGSGLPNLCLYDNWNTGANVFGSYVPLSPHYTMSLYYQGGTFEFMVADLDPAGSDGQVQYIILELEGLTNPLDNDTDDDGLLDGEEVNLGEDGWITNPVLRDTDSDWIWDSTEIQGNTACGEALDPTSADTDGDGFFDDVDRALGDMVVRISITHFTPQETLWTPWPIGNNNPMAFFTISANDYYYSTEAVGTTVGTTTTISDRSYYIDVYDSNTSITATISAWASNPSGGWPISDMRFDISPDSGSVSVSPFFSLLGQPNVATYYQYSGDSAGDCDASITIMFEKIILQKTRTILVNGVHDGDSYGLYDEGGHLRYSADTQVYILYLDCTSSSSNFVVGLNTIILPRSVAVESRLNDVLRGLVSPSGTPLQGAVFYGNEGNTCSAHVIAVISNTLTGSQAETLLQMMTQDASYGQIGEHRVVSSEQLYLAHLPSDVLYSVPLQEFHNSPTSRSPSVWQETFLTTVVDIASFMFHALVNLPSFIADLVVTVIAFAIDKLGEIISAVGQEIQTAVNKIVDAFQAFLDWLVDFVCDTILDPLTSMIEDIWNGVVDWAAGLGATLSRLAAEVDAGARSIASATLALVQSIVESDAFLVISLIGFTIFTVMLVLQPTVAPFMFVLDMIVPIVMMAILDANGGFITDAAGEIASAAASTMENTIRSILGNDLVNMEATMFGIIFSSVGSLITFVSTAVMGTMRDFASFAVSIMGAILSVASLTQINEQPTFGWVGVSCLGLACSMAGFTLDMIGKGTGDKICPSFDSVSKLISGLDLGVSALSVGTTYNAWSSGE